MQGWNWPIDIREPRVGNRRFPIVGLLSLTCIDTKFGFVALTRKGKQEEEFNSLQLRYNKSQTLHICTLGKVFSGVKYKWTFL